jgi:hypothetical protein
MISQNLVSIVCFCVFLFSLQFDPSSGRLNFLIVTVTNAPSIGAAAMAPGFSIALEDMSIKYHTLFKDYSITTVSIAPADQDICSPGASWLLTERISQLYGAGALSSTDGQRIILTSGKVPLKLRL